MRNPSDNGRRRTIRPAFTVVELVVATAIIAMTTFLALTVYDPTGDARKNAASTQLEQLGQGILLYNLNNPAHSFDGTTISAAGEPQTVAWWTALGPDFFDEKMLDPWNRMYEHDPERGLVYSYGPDGLDDLAAGDDLVYFYRPPSAFVRERFPTPGSTIATVNPQVRSVWLFRGSAGVTTGTIWLDGTPYDTSTASPNPPTSVVQLATPPTLAQGAHTVRVRAGDGDELVGRSSWEFKVDTIPPNVYQVQPSPDTQTNYQAFPTTIYYQDVSGVAMRDPGTPPNLAASSPQLHIVGAPAGYGGPPSGTTLYGPKAIRDAFPGASVTPGAISLPAPGGQWAFSGGTPYEFRIVLRDIVGNEYDSSLDAGFSWRFEIVDTSLPHVNVQLPEYASSLTSSADIDPITSGVQIDIIGNSEPLAQVDLVSSAHPSAPSSTPLYRTYANSFGQFTFEDVTVYSSDAGSPHATNELFFEARDAQGNVTPSQVRHVLYVFDEDSTVKLRYADASPQTTLPNESILFSAGAVGGTTPYKFTFDFDDGYELEDVAAMPFTTFTDTAGVASVNHAYRETGTFSVTVTARDAAGLEDSKLLSVYVGDESDRPDISLEAVPPELAIGSPGKDVTNFQVTINGRFLGHWRLRVDPDPTTPANQWWFTGDDFWVENGRAAIEPDEPNTLWQPASSNDFSVPWFGRDNTNFGDRTCNLGCSGPPHPISTSTLALSRAFQNGLHVATLEYRDAFGESSAVTAPIFVFNDTPNATGVRVVSLNGDPNAYGLFDFDFDGTPDYTNQPRVDLLIPKPATTNASDLWISNYPVDMHYYSHPASPFTTFRVEVPRSIDKERGEVFQNVTLASGEFYDATDGSSGWIPHRDDDIYRNWDITADMSSQVYPDSHLPWRMPTDLPGPRPGGCENLFDVPIGSIPTHYGARAKGSGGCPHDIVTGDFYNAGAPAGLNLTTDGPHNIYAIFRAAGPFISTQINSGEATPHTSGVTSTDIYLDTQPPVPLEGIELVNIDVQQTAGGQELVIADIRTNVTDGAGSGMQPRGRTVISLPARPLILLPYADDLRVTLGRYDELANSVTGNITLTAAVVFEDNLGNRSVPFLPPSTLSFLDLDLIQYQWTIIGSGDLNFFQSSSEPGPGNIVRIDHQAINASNTDGPPAAPTLSYRTEDWLNLVPQTGEVDGAVRAAQTNIATLNFPNPNDRLGVLQAVRPPVDGNFIQAGTDTGGTIEAQQTFPVDNEHCYVLQLERVPLTGEVTYTVRERPRFSGVDCATSYTVQDTSGVPIAAIDKVRNIPLGRFNFGRVALPRDVGTGSSNVLLDRVANQHDDTSLAFDETDVWDVRRDLIQSNDPSQFKTYTFRGVVGEFDSGTQGDIDYLVSIDNFLLRAFFIEPGAAIEHLNQADPYFGPAGVHLVDPTTAEPPGVLGRTPRFVKVVSFDEANTGLPPENFGFGPLRPGSPIYDNTFLADDPESLGGPAAPSGIGGTRFHVNFAGPSNAFLPFTTGTIQAAGYLMFEDFTGVPPPTSPQFDSSACASSPCGFPGAFADNGPPTNDALEGPAAGGSPQIARFEFQYKSDGDGLAITPFAPQDVGLISPFDDPFETIPTAALKTGLRHDLVGDLPVTMHFDWAHLANREGYVQMAVAYRDAYDNTIGTIVRPPYALDALPPSILPTDVALRGRTSNYVEETYTLAPLSVPRRHWTSQPDIELVVEGSEFSEVFRELIRGTPDQTGAGLIMALPPGDEGCAAPNAPSAGPGICDPNNWKSFAGPPMLAATEYTEDLTLSTPITHEGGVTATLRFRDAFFNYTPAFIGPVDDGPDGTPDQEPNFQAEVFVDVTPPRVENLRVLTAAIPPTDTNIRDPGQAAGGAGDARHIFEGGKLWTNYRHLDFEFDLVDHAGPGCADPADHDRCAVGMNRAGANAFLRINGPVVAPGTGPWPAPYALRMPAHYPANDSQAARHTAIGRRFTDAPLAANQTCSGIPGDPPDPPAGSACADIISGTLPDNGVVANNFFELYVRDNLGNGDPVPTVGIAAGDGTTPVPNTNFVAVPFGYDNEGPQLGSLPPCLPLTITRLPGEKVDQLPGVHFEDLLTTVVADGATIDETISVPEDAHLTATQVEISLADPTLGPFPSDITVTAIELHRDGADTGAVLSPLPVTLSARDPESWVRTLTIVSGATDTDAARVVATASASGGGSKLMVRVRGTRDGANPDHLASPASFLAQTPAAPYPATGFSNSNIINVRWPAIEDAVSLGCVDDGAGVGVRQGGPAAPWGVCPGSTTTNCTDLQAHFTAEPTTAAVIDLGGSGGSATPQLLAYDLLENFAPGEAVELFDASLDITEPPPAAGVGTSAATFGVSGVARAGALGVGANVTLNWTPTADPNPSGHYLYRRVDRGSTDMAATFTGGMRVAFAPTGTPMASAALFDPTGQMDGWYHYSVFPEDLAGNINASVGANQVSLVLDTTPPQSTAPLGVVASGDPPPPAPHEGYHVVDRSGVIGAQTGLPCSTAAPVSGCDENWTNDPNVAVTFEVQDLAVNHPQAPYDTRAGSGVQRVIASHVNGPATPHGLGFDTDLTTFTSGPTVGGPVFDTRPGVPIPHGFNGRFHLQANGGPTGLVGPASTGNGLYHFGLAPEDYAGLLGPQEQVSINFDDTGPNWVTIPLIFPLPTNFVLTFWDDAGCSVGPTVRPIVVLGADVTAPTGKQCITLTFNGILATARATDPGHPNSGVGVTTNPAHMPPGVELFRGSLGGAFSSETDTETFQFPFAGGLVEVFARDLLGNEGAPLTVCNILADVEPPTVAEITRVCYEGVCDGSVVPPPGVNDDLTIWPTDNTGSPGNLGDHLGLAEMEHGLGFFQGRPTACAGCNVPDGPGFFWIRGSAQDPDGPSVGAGGGGFRTDGLGGENPISVTFRAVNAPPTLCTTTVDINHYDGDLYLEPTGTLEPAIDWWVRLPAPQTIAGCPQTFWDHAASGDPNNIIWEIALTATDRAGLTRTQSRFGRVDVAAPAPPAVPPGSVEATGNVTWTNLGDVQSGGTWQMTGLAPGSDLDPGWPQFSVRNGAGTTFAGMDFLDSAPHVSGAGPYTCDWPSGVVPAIEAQDIQVAMQARDLYGNSIDGPPLTGLQVDTVLPTATVNPPYAYCGTTVDSPFDATITDAFPVEVRLDYCGDGANSTSCPTTAIVSAAIPHTALAGSPDFILSGDSDLSPGGPGPGDLEMGATLPNQWEVTAVVWDEADNQNSSPAVTVDVGPPPDGNAPDGVSANRPLPAPTGSDGNPWVNLTATSGGWTIGGEVTVGSATDVYIRLLVGPGPPAGLPAGTPTAGVVHGFPSDWGDLDLPGASATGSTAFHSVANAGSVGNLIVSATGMPGAGPWTATIDQTWIDGACVDGVVNRLFVEVYYIGCTAPVIVSGPHHSPGVRLDTQLPGITGDVTIVELPGGPDSWFNLSNGDVAAGNSGGGFSDTCSGFGAVGSESLQEIRIAGPAISPPKAFVPVSDPADSPGNAQPWSHNFTAAYLAGIDNEDQARTEVLLTDVAGNQSSTGTPLAFASLAKVDYQLPAEPTPGAGSPSVSSFCTVPGAPVQVDVDCDPAIPDTPASGVRLFVCGDNTGSCMGFASNPNISPATRPCDGSTQSFQVATALFTTAGDTYRFEATNQDQAGNERSATGANIQEVAYSQPPSVDITHIEGIPEASWDAARWLNVAQESDGIQVSGTYTGTPDSISLAVALEGGGTTYLAFDAIDGAGPVQGSFGSNTFTATIDTAAFSPVPPTCMQGAGAEMEIQARIRLTGCLDQFAAPFHFQVDIAPPTINFDAGGQGAYVTAVESGSLTGDGPDLPLGFEPDPRSWFRVSNGDLTVGNTAPDAGTINEPCSGIDDTAPQTIQLNTGGPTIPLAPPASGAGAQQPWSHTFDETTYLAPNTDNHPEAEILIEVHDNAGNTSGAISATGTNRLALDYTPPAPPELDAVTPTAVQFCAVADQFIAYNCGTGAANIQLYYCDDLLTNANCADTDFSQDFGIVETGLQTCATPFTFTATTSVYGAPPAATANQRRFRFRAQNEDVAGNVTPATEGTGDIPDHDFVVVPEVTITDTEEDPTTAPGWINGTHLGDELVDGIDPPAGLDIRGEWTGLVDSIEIQVESPIGNPILTWEAIDTSGTVQGELTPGPTNTWEATIAAGLFSACHVAPTNGLVIRARPTNATCAAAAHAEEDSVIRRLDATPPVVSNFTVATLPVITSAYPGGVYNLSNITGFQVTADYQDTCSGLRLVPSPIRFHIFPADPSAEDYDGFPTYSDGQTTVANLDHTFSAGYISGLTPQDGLPQQIRVRNVFDVAGNQGVDTPATQSPITLDNVAPGDPSITAITTTLNGAGTDGSDCTGSCGGPNPGTFNAPQAAIVGPSPPGDNHQFDYTATCATCGPDYLKWTFDPTGSPSDPVCDDVDDGLNFSPPAIDATAGSPFPIQPQARLITCDPAGNPSSVIYSTYNFVDD